MSQLNFTNFVDGDVPTASGFNSRFLLAINLINSGLEADNLASNAVTTAKIATNAVTTTKMEAGTQGDVPYYGGSGAFSRLTAGTSGQFLTTLGAGANPAWADVPQSVGGSWLNLAVTRPGTTQVTVTADQLIVRSVAGSGVRITSVNVTGTITTAGANGLDTGSEAANTIYYVWVIRKSSDGTVASLLSTASAIGSITFPSGYDQAALVSAVGNNDSSDFINFKQTGKMYDFVVWGELDSGNRSPWTSLDLTPANMSTVAAFVPSALSNRCYGSCAVGAGSNAAIMTNDSSVSSTPTTVAPNKYYFGVSNNMSPWEFTVLTADTLYWGSDTAGAKVYLAGFEINKLV